MGGGFSRGGQLARGGGYVLRAPTLDISEIGAGGGSIVWIDSGGALHVGPKSAGASPGPVCYGQGGTEPTLTDACVVLGYLGEGGLAGGAVQLDRQAAETALRENIAAPLRMDVVDLAFGVLRIAVSNMTRAIRSVSTERGKDPRDFDLIAFGGNGGVFSAAVARELSLRKVIIPPAAGIFSAFGLLYSNLEHHFTQTLLGRVDEIDPAIVPRGGATSRRRRSQSLAAKAFRLSAAVCSVSGRCVISARPTNSRFPGQPGKPTARPRGTYAEVRGNPSPDLRASRPRRHRGTRKSPSRCSRCHRQAPRAGSTVFPTGSERKSQPRRVWFGPNLAGRMTPITSSRRARRRRYPRPVDHTGVRCHDRGAARFPRDAGRPVQYRNDAERSGRRRIVARRGTPAREWFDAMPN